MALFLAVMTFTVISTPHEARVIVLTLAALACLPIASFSPVVGATLSFFVTWTTEAVPFSTGVTAGAACWGVAALLMARGLPHLTVYLFSCSILLLQLHNPAWPESLVWPLLVGAPCLVLGETIRRQRQHAETLVRTQERRTERQLRLITSELHDTVVRDLTHMVMAAQQAKAVHPENEVLVHELDAAISQVRRSVEHLRRSLRAMSAANGDEALALLLSIPPRPVNETLEEARHTLAERGITLRTEGVDILEGDTIPAGTRQQVVRVVDELIVNATKYAHPPGNAAVQLEVDDDTLICMVSNDTSTTPAEDTALTSGIGVKGARHRIELLGGSFTCGRVDDRWVTIFSVPLGQQPSTKGL